MVMVTSGREESRLRAVSLHQFKPQHPTVEIQRPLEIRYFEMNMPDARAGIYRALCSRPGVLLLHVYLLSSSLRFQLCFSYHAANSWLTPPCPSHIIGASG